MRILFNVEKYPSSFLTMIAASTQIPVTSYLSYRSDRVQLAITGQSDVFMDFLLMRANASSSLRLVDGAEMTVWSVDFMNKDIIRG